MESQDTTVERVAVIIVNYNAGDMLRRCLASLAAQSVRPYRVLVMDNGSHDRSVDDCETAFPWVEFHRLNANLGFARANNLAVDRVSDCEWLALLNPDAFPEPSWLESMLRAARRFPDTDTFASCMLADQPRGMVDGAGDAYRVDGLAWSRYQGEPATRLPVVVEEVFAPSAGAGFYRRRVFVETGGFCERYFCYYEDVDLGFRLRLRGVRCRFLPDAVVYHVGSALTGKGSEFSIYHAHRNFVWTYLRNMPSPYVWWFLPAHLLANLVSIVVFALKGRGWTILRAKRDALRGLRRTWRERREIQRGNRVAAPAVVQLMERGNALRSIVRMAFRRARTATARAS